MSEAPIMRRVMLAIGARPDTRIFRNNVGLAVFPDGSRVRYGLAPGSSDLIGWRSLLIGPEHVGMQLAQFVAIEVKGPKGRAEDAQAKFLHAVAAAGGIAGVVRSVEEAERLLGEEL